MSSFMYLLFKIGVVEDWVRLGYNKRWLTNEHLCGNHLDTRTLKYTIIYISILKRNVSGRSAFTNRAFLNCSQIQRFSLSGLLLERCHAKDCVMSNVTSWLDQSRFHGWRQYRATYSGYSQPASICSSDGSEAWDRRDKNNLDCLLPRIRACV